LARIDVNYRVNLNFIITRRDFSTYSDDYDLTNPAVFLSLIQEHSENESLNVTAVEIIMNNDGSAFVKPKKGMIYDRGHDLSDAIRVI